MNATRATHAAVMAIVFLAGATLAEPLWAQATAEKDVVKDVIVNDATNYVGDRIRFAVKVDAKLRKAPQTVFCIPPLTRMSVIGKDDSSKNLIVKIADSTKACDGSAIDTGEAYLITLDTLAQSGLARTGATYGALVVPFKYHLTGNKDFTGSSTLGAYLGYRFETANAIGYTLTPVAFMGGSTVSVPTSSGGEIKDQNFAGFAYGMGLIGTFKGSFQAGVVLGWDRVSKSAGYQYNGKPWLAVEIGFSFMQ